MLDRFNKAEEFLHDKDFIRTCYNSLGDLFIVITGDEFEEDNETFGDHLEDYFEFCKLRNRTIQILYFHGQLENTWFDDGSVPEIRQAIKKFMKSPDLKDVENTINFTGIGLNKAAKSAMTQYFHSFDSSHIDAKYYDSLVDFLLLETVKNDPEFVLKLISVL